MAKQVPQQLPRVNYLYAMMKAVEKDQNSLTQMQITDSKSTEIAVNIESNIYEYWNGPNGPLADYVRDIGKWADGSLKKDANMVAWFQMAYNQASARAQSNESQEDGVVQAGQGQTSADASNLQMKAQMIQGINSILSALTNMLGRIVG